LRFGGTRLDFARARQNDFRPPLGSLWFNWATYYDGAQWVGPILVPHSDNLLYNIPAVVPLKEGGLLIAHSSDHRQDRHIQRKAEAATRQLDSDKDPFDNDIFLSRLAVAGEVKRRSLSPRSTRPPPSSRDARDSDEREGHRSLPRLRAKIERQRAANPARRISPPHRDQRRRRNDGRSKTCGRYAIDVAAMDWLGCGDQKRRRSLLRQPPWISRPPPLS